MKQDRRQQGKKHRWTEFDCPECTAHNPWDEGFGEEDRVICNWCGLSFRVKVRMTDEGPRYKLQED